ISKNPLVTTSTDSKSFGTLLLFSSSDYAFSLEPNTLTNMTVSLTSGNVLSLLGGVGFTLYQVNAAGGLTQVQSGSNGILLDLLGLVGDSMQVQISGLPAGNYVLRVASSGISVISNVSGTFQFETTHLDQFVGKSGGPVSGNVINNADGQD